MPRPALGAPSAHPAAYDLRSPLPPAAADPDPHPPNHALAAAARPYWQAFREVDLHRRFVHPNIVSLYGAFVEDDYLVLVQEYAQGSDLFALSRRLGGRMAEQQAVTYVLLPMLQVRTAVRGGASSAAQSMCRAWCMSLERLSFLCAWRETDMCPRTRHCRRSPTCTRWRSCTGTSR